MSDWLISQWTNAQWYEQMYMLAIIVLLISLLLYLIFLPAHTQVSSEINSEYNRLASSHFFMTFRKKKQNELYNKASNSVKSRSKNYLSYKLANFFSSIAAIAASVAFWFFIGSIFYEKILSESINENPSIVEYDDSGDYDEYDDSGDYDDDNIHHVDAHWVDGYERSDGTEVDGYWRGGEDGYDRSDPDDDLSNNLDYDGNDSGESGGFFDGFFND